MKSREIVSEIKNLDKLSQLEGEKVVQYSDSIGEQLQRRGLKTNQIRRFWSAINKLKTRIKTGDRFERDKVLMLKPKLAYAAGRKREVKDLFKVIDPCIDRVYDREDFTVFTNLMESIVAYHKYHGGQ